MNAQYIPLRFLEMSTLFPDLDTRFPERLTTFLSLENILLVLLEKTSSEASIRLDSRAINIIIFFYFWSFPGCEFSVLKTKQVLEYSLVYKEYALVFI